MEQTKRCKVCGEVKPIERFDKAKGCTDGRRCTCRDCRNEIAKKRKDVVDADPILSKIAKEKSHRSYIRRKTLGTYKPSKTKNGMNVSRQLKRRGYDMVGKVAHHWNYNLPKSVFILGKRAHMLIHRFMTVDYETNLCYTNDGILLETPEQARDFFLDILKKSGLDEEIQYVDYSHTPTLREITDNRFYHKNNKPILV